MPEELHLCCEGGTELCLSLDSAYSLEPADIAKVLRCYLDMACQNKWQCHGLYCFAEKALKRGVNSYEIISDAYPDR